MKRKKKQSPIDKGSNQKAEDENESKLQDDCYEYIKDFAQIIYDNEVHREANIFQQASQMQTAFSFVIAAVLMVVPVAVEHRGELTYNYLLIGFSIIVFLLAMSLFMATMAQNRKKRVDYPKIETISKKIVDEYKSFATAAQRSKYYAETLQEIQNSYSDTNDKRITFLRISMWFFYAALIACLVFFIVSLLILCF